MPAKKPPAKAAKAAKGAKGGGGPKGGGVKKKSKKSDHIYDVSELAAHNTPAGGCICAHDGCGDYNVNVKCSYRWQAHDYAFKNLQWKFHKYPVDPKGAKSIATLGRVTDPTTGAMYPPSYATAILIPLYNGDWDLDGPKRATVAALLKVLLPLHQSAGGVPIPDGANFCDNWLWPYWHNAHHLIPKDTLRAMIDTYAASKSKTPGGSSIRSAMRLELLNAPYNIHGPPNMLILPQDEDVAKVLALPRHLGLKLHTNTNFDHPTYNKYVTTELKTIFDAFELALSAGVHNAAQTAKFGLEALSTKLMNKATGLAQADWGLSLDDVFK